MLAIISEKSIPLFKVFDERQKRLWAATEALPLGRGGITAVANVSGLCRAAIRQGIKELYCRRGQMGRFALWNLCALCAFVVNSFEPQRHKEHKENSAIIGIVQYSVRKPGLTFSTETCRMNSQLECPTS